MPAAVYDKTYVDNVLLAACVADGSTCVSNHWIIAGGPGTRTTANGTVRMTKGVRYVFL